MPLKNTYFKEKTKSPKIPTSVYVFFLILLFVFGLDFGFKQFLKKKIRIVANCIQVFIIFVILIIQILPVARPNVYDYYLYFYIVSYVFHYIYLYRAKYTLCDLMIDVHGLIDKNTTMVKNRAGRIILIHITLTCVTKYAFCILNCILHRSICLGSIIPGYIHCIPVMVLDEIVIIHILINYYIYIAVKYIKESMKKVDTSLLLNNFVRVADSWDKIKPLYTRLVSIYTNCYYCL